LLGVTDRQREAIYGLYKTEVNARRVYDDWDDVQTALDEYKGKLHKTAGHAHRWSYGYLPGTGYRHCACGEIEEVFPSGPPKPMAEKEKGFVRRHLEKSAAYLFGEKLAMDPFASMNWVPSNFAVAAFAGHPQIPDRNHHPGQPVPEPSTIILVGAGIVGVIAWKKRKQ
jgi:hypothetical protein